MSDYARGEYLKELREGRRLNQEDAAHEIGVSAKTLRTWEKGGPIKWENAKAAGAFYEVDPEQLVTRETSTADLSDAFSQAEPDSELKEMLREVLDQQAQLLADVSVVRSEQERLSPLLERLESDQGARRRSSSS